MNCENHFCVYQADGRCTLDEVQLDITGSCTECIYVELDEGMIRESKQKFLSAFHRQTGKNLKKKKFF